MDPNHVLNSEGFRCAPFQQVRATLCGIENNDAIICIR